MLLGDVEIGEHIGLAIVDEGGQLRPFLPQLVGEVPQHRARLGPVGLQKGLAQRGGHYALLGLRHMARALRIECTRAPLKKVAAAALMPHDLSWGIRGPPHVGEKRSTSARLFVAGSLRELILEDHILVRLDQVLDLSWPRAQVSELYSADNGRPGIDPEVAVRLMLLVFCLVSFTTAD
jgi:hypothetical protein